MPMISQNHHFFGDCDGFAMHTSAWAQRRVAVQGPRKPRAAAWRKRSDAA